MQQPAFRAHYSSTVVLRYAPCQIPPSRQTLILLYYTKYTLNHDQCVLIDFSVKIVFAYNVLVSHGHTCIHKERQVHTGTTAVDHQSRSKLQQWNKPLASKAHRSLVGELLERTCPQNSQPVKY